MNRPSPPETMSYEEYMNYIRTNSNVLNQLECLSCSDQIMLLLCGIPGSGKSTFAKSMVGGLPDSYRKKWVVANQDRLKTRERVLNAAKEALHGKRSVSIDRCNIDRKQRAVWVELARQFNVSAIICVVMPNNSDIDLCISRANERGASDCHEAGVDWRKVCSIMKHDFQMPSVSEGFTGVFMCRDESDLGCLATAITNIGLRASTENRIDLPVPPPRESL